MSAPSESGLSVSFGFDQFVGPSPLGLGNDEGGSYLEIAENINLSLLL